MRFYEWNQCFLNLYLFLNTHLTVSASMVIFFAAVNIPGNKEYYLFAWACNWANSDLKYYGPNNIYINHIYLPKGLIDCICLAGCFIFTCFAVWASKFITTTMAHNYGRQSLTAIKSFWIDSAICGAGDSAAVRVTAHLFAAQRRQRHN